MSTTVRYTGKGYTIQAPTGELYDRATLGEVMATMRYFGWSQPVWVM